MPLATLSRAGFFLPCDRRAALRLAALAPLFAFEARAQPRHQIDDVGRLRGLALLKLGCVP